MPAVIQGFLSDNQEDLLRAVYDCVVSSEELNQTEKTLIPSYVDTLDPFFVYMSNQALPLHVTSAFLMPEDFIANQYARFLKNTHNGDIINGALYLNAQDLTPIMSGLKVETAGGYIYIGISEQEVLSLLKEDDFIVAFTQDANDPTKLSGEAITKIRLGMMQNDSINFARGHAPHSNRYNNNGTQFWHVNTHDNEPFNINGVEIFMDAPDRITIQDAKNNEIIGSYIYTGEIDNTTSDSKLMLSYISYFRTILADLAIQASNPNVSNTSLKRMFSHASNLAGLAIFVFGYDKNMGVLSNVWEQLDFFRKSIMELSQAQDPVITRKEIAELWQIMANPVTHIRRSYMKAEKNSDRSGVLPRNYTVTLELKSDVLKTTLSQQTQINSFIDSMFSELLATTPLDRDIVINFIVKNNKIEIKIISTSETFKPTFKIPHNFLVTHSTKRNIQYTEITIPIPHTVDQANERHFYAFSADDEMFEFCGEKIPSGWSQLTKSQKLEVIVQVYDIRSTNSFDSFKSRLELSELVIQEVLNETWQPKGLANIWLKLNDQQKSAAVKMILSQSNASGITTRILNNANLPNIINAARLMTISPSLIH